MPPSQLAAQARIRYRHGSHAQRQPEFLSTLHYQPESTVLTKENLVSGISFSQLGTDETCLGSPQVLNLA